MNACVNVRMCTGERERKRERQNEKESERAWWWWANAGRSGNASRMSV